MMGRRNAPRAGGVPVLPGFHPDPSVCRVDDVYYLACSSFEYAPGVPLFRSPDLRTWEPLGHALDRSSQLDLTGADASGGIYAPTLRHHDDQFWMITTNVTDGGGHLLVTAPDPAGRWSDPVRFPALAGIDPDLAWDATGTCWLTWSGTHPETGAHGILQAPVDPARGEAIGETRRLWSGTGGKAPEAPHLYEIEGVWYLLISEGGTERGHAVTVARGPAPDGPFRGDDQNPVLTRRGTDRAVQATGHADLVQRSDGSWAMVHLGVRPVGASQHMEVLRRPDGAHPEVDHRPRAVGPLHEVGVPGGLHGPVCPPAREYGVLVVAAEWPVWGGTSGHRHRVPALGATLGDEQVPDALDLVQVRRLGGLPTGAGPQSPGLTDRLTTGRVDRRLEDSVGTRLGMRARPGEPARPGGIPREVGVDAGQRRETHRIGPAPGGVRGGDEQVPATVGHVGGDHPELVVVVTQRRRVDAARGIRPGQVEL